jgi:hypothetical protein
MVLRAADVDSSSFLLQEGTRRIEIRAAAEKVAFVGAAVRTFFDIGA